MNRPFEARRTLAIGVGAVLSAFLVVFGGLQVVQATTWATQHDSMSFRQTIRHIEVDSGARVSIYGEPSNTVNVKRTISESIGHPRPESYVDGDTLHLSGGCNVLFIGWCSIRYEVRLPAAVPLTVHSSDGQVSAENMRAHLSMTADSGDLSAKNIYGSLTMSASSGRISADSVTGKSMRLDADSGRISASGISVRDFEARASSGRVSAEFKTDPKSVVAEADSGTIDIVVPQDETAYDVTGVSADSGSKDVGIKSHTGAVNKIVAHASSGQISVEYSD
jgi:hypothetical protein